MKLLRSLLFAGAVAFVCRDASAGTIYNINAVGYLNVQGALHENGQPVNGFWEFCFDIFNVATGGSPLAHDTNMNIVLVSNGVANVC